ncbi:MAG: TIGR01212 family radical SAM protein [Oscillospiraceae bacterium]
MDSNDTSHRFPYSSDNKRYHTWSYHLKQTFGRKACKVPLSLGTTCPNRDGTVGSGGCTFCLGGGGGSLHSDAAAEMEAAYTQGLNLQRRKWPDAAGMPYFQSFTNTYIPNHRLRAALEAASRLPDAVGISIATRPDALPPDILDCLEEFAACIYLVVELGLQTAHDATGRRLNRGHSFDAFLEGYRKLADRNIQVCIHLINGLPGEDADMMLETACQVALLCPHSIKFHMLHLLEGTRLLEEYRQKPFPLFNREEYVDILCSQIELLPPETVVQRITGDPPRELLAAPEWTRNKLWVRNALDKEFLRRDSFQGKLYHAPV